MSSVPWLEAQEASERYAAWTRQVAPPPSGPYKNFWMEAACDLQRALDSLLKAEATNSQPKEQA